MVSAEPTAGDRSTDTRYFDRERSPDATLERVDSDHLETHYVAALRGPTPV
jgi:hypothetical protein